MSENAEFAQNVIDSGLIWIGPKPDTIISMGNKDVAREKAINSNLPICPGLKNDDLSSENLEKKCLDIGYPILIKASAGGGGIGMNIVNNFSELKTAIDKTKNLAKKAFGNSDIFLEKFIRNSRHIEIQVFGYGENNAVRTKPEVVRLVIVAPNPAGSIIILPISKPIGNSVNENVIVLSSRLFVPS